MGGEYQTSMNKYWIIISVLFMFNCSNTLNQKEPVNALLKGKNGNLIAVDTLNKVSSKKEEIDDLRNIFIPDITINKKLYLRADNTLSEIFSNISNIELIEQERICPVALFTNNDNSEYLLAYQYEGDTKNSFACFEIGYRKDFSKFIPIRTKEKKFQTESGIHLGMTLSELELIKGKGYDEKKISEKKMVLTYHISDMHTSAFLKHYNMPGYFIKITLKDEKIMRILFGFDYP